MNSGPAFTRDVEQLIASRVGSLSGLSYGEVAELPEAVGEEVVVAGRRGTVTVYSQSLRDRELLVTVQIAFPELLGFASSHYERGLVFSAIGSVRGATSEELIRSGG